MIYADTDKQTGLTHFILETDDDLANLPNAVKPGSTALVSSSGKQYKLDNNQIWISQNSEEEQYDDVFYICDPIPEETLLRILEA